LARLDRLLTLGLLGLLVAGYMQAQWSNDPAVDISIGKSAIAQFQPTIVSGGNGGAIITLGPSTTLTMMPSPLFGSLSCQEPGDKQRG